MKNTKINLEIRKDDAESNDYLFCWSEMGERPNKIVLNDFFESEKFFDQLSKFEWSNKGTYLDIIPEVGSNIHNERRLLKLQDKLWVSFYHLDKESDEDLVTEVQLFYLDESYDSAIQFVKSIENEVEKAEEVKEHKIKISYLTLTGNGYDLESINLLKSDFENIDNYFNVETIVKTEKLIKSISKSSKGLSIICGEKGLGKTTLASYIANECKKNVIFVPTNMIEVALSSPEFTKFLRRHKNSLMIIDDVEIFFNDAFSKTTFFSTNLLQLVDGFLSDNLDLNIILIFNVVDQDEIDRSILLSNNLIDFIKVDSLSSDKTNELLTFLNKNGKINNKNKLVDILKIKNFEVKGSHLGYK